MEVLGGDVGVIVWSLSIGLIGLLITLYRAVNNNENFNLSLSVIRQRRKLRRQGINGPQPSLLHGNAPELQRINTQSTAAKPPSQLNGAAVSHDFVAAVFPYFTHWAKEYGKVYTYTLKKRQLLYVNKPEMVREMNQNMSLDMGKPTNLTKQLFPLFGNGILRANGALWSRQRKMISPEFYTDKVKGMVGLMREASELLVKKWEAAILEGGSTTVELRVDEDLRSFSADVIARACFGSSYVKGKHIFSRLRTLQQMLSSHGRFLFKNNSRAFAWRKSERELEIKRLEKEVNDLIWETVQERVNDSNSKDLLQLLLQSSDEYKVTDKKKKRELIIDICKNIYFAGHETTAVSSAWCLVLLAYYPEWQRRLRQEVMEESQQPPTFDALNKMKWLNMFLQEALRLYSPGVFVTREVLKEVRLGEVVVPKGVQMWTLIPSLHRDTDLWGPDALEFKPERFADGVANACTIPQTYIPFGVGPRNCLGKNFAMAELRLILTHILSNFSFTLSPNYNHAPSFSMVLEPAHGVRLLVNKIG